MPNYTIDEFWKALLPPKQPLKTASFVKGWFQLDEGLRTFREAPLSLNPDLTIEKAAYDNSIFLISAPGAVGKSTLARQIASVTGAIYIDLALADPVGGNSISGGLVRSDLYGVWQYQQVTLLIDGLDEARLRVTQEAFEAFLSEIAALSQNRNSPTILFGRTGAVQDAWLSLVGQKAKVAVFEIGYYGPDASADFAEARFKTLSPDNPHASVARKSIELLIARLREQTEFDGDRFSGYAPVLEAVAERVAYEENLAALVSQIEKGEQPVTLRGVVESIMNRERKKLSNLDFKDSGLLEALYSSEEQLERLVARVYGLPTPDMPKMAPEDAHSYSTALATWVPEHPFLNGGRAASSAVFEALICAKALKNSASQAVAAQRELNRGAGANPFLADFYLVDEMGKETSQLPIEHLGIIYSSLRARLSLGDSASLSVEGMEEAEDAEDENILRAEVEITVARQGVDKPKILKFDTEQTGTLRFGGYLEDVELMVPHTHVEVGAGKEAVLVAPVNIQCDSLSIAADMVVVERQPNLDDGVVFLEANNLSSSQVVSVPILRGGASLAVVWPHAKVHPWTSFATEPTPITDARLEEALRRFRKFVTAFRSHSKGSLARYQHKLEHARMTKGTGQAVLDLLVDEKIISLHGPMYHLDPKLLGEVAGAAYADVVKRNFNDRTIAFVRRALT